MGCKPSEIETELQLSKPDEHLDLARKTTACSLQDPPTQGPSQIPTQVSLGSEKTNNLLKIPEPFCQSFKDSKGQEVKGVELNAVVFEMDLSPDQMQEELSIIIDDLFQRYDPQDKGYLNLQQFQDLVTKHSKHPLKEQDILAMLNLSSKETPREIDRLQLYQLCLPSIPN